MLPGCHLLFVSGLSLQSLPLFLLSALLFLSSQFFFEELGALLWREEAQAGIGVWVIEHRERCEG
jgi:hypothetical protein